MRFSKEMAVIVGTLALGVAVAYGRDGKHTERPAAHHDKHGGVFGEPGEASQVSRTISVEMTDGMRFIPASVIVSKGETIRFVVKNTGALKHEMVLGTLKELREHAAMMRKFPGMQHADPNQVRVPPRGYW